MLVMNVMSSKRQRRPNVRLGEIGDMSAAWACGFSHRNRGKLAHKEWKNDLVHQTVGDEDNPIVYGDLNPSSPKVTVSEMGVSPQISTELQQNGENNINPNSSELALECPISTELIDMTKSKLKFSDVTRKSRDMRRRGRSRNGYAIIGGSWSSKHSSDDFSMDEKECEGTGNSATGFGDSSDHQTPTTSKEEYGIDQPSTRQERKLNNDFTGKEARHKSSNVQDQMRIEDDDTNAVSRWLEEVGFGKYAGVFEMHEVDEEALPLLTIEDLKEIGVLSVGSRRKLYNAIQQLRGGEEEEEEETV